MRSFSVRAIAVVCALTAAPAFADHVNSEPTLVIHTTPAQALDVSRLLDRLGEAGLKDTAPGGSAEEFYKVGEFIFEAVLVDGTPISRELGYRSEGLWHRSGELNDADAGFANAVAHGTLSNAQFCCRTGYPLPLLACTRTRNAPATAQCEVNYRCISID